MVIFLVVLFHVNDEEGAVCVEKVGDGVEGAEELFVRGGCVGVEGGEKVYRELDRRGEEDVFEPCSHHGLF